MLTNLYSPNTYKVCKPILVLLFFVVCYFNNINNTQATHIKAGEITARFVGNSEIEFTMVLFMSIESLNKTPDLITQQATADFQFSDRASVVTVSNPTMTDIDNDTRQYTYTGRVRNVPPGTTFTISYIKLNRNANIKNIAAGQSEVPFYLQTTIYTTQTRNTLPKLTIPPIDEGAVGQIFTHNPGAVDADGDSLSYTMTVPRADKGFPVNQFVKPEFVQPGPAVGGGAAFSNISATKGDFVWNAPTLEGLYNVAIEITEWRKSPVDGRYRKLSVMVRDMQINVKKNPNRRPELIIPNDTCVEAGVNTIFRDTILTYDPDSIRPRNYQNIYLTAVKLPNGSSFSLINPLNPVGTNLVANPGAGIFTWNAGCAAIRQQPYFVTFKAADQVVASQQMVTFKSWQIRVNGPRPSGVKINRQVTGFMISWDKYPCTNSDSIIIYRRDCGNGNYTPKPCETSLPPDFTKIGSVSNLDISYLDTFNIVQGNNYCYILGARFGGTSQGNSVLSEEHCMSSFYYEPLLTKVSVIKSDVEKGQIAVQWMRPLGAKDGNFQYVLSRKSTEANALFKSIFTTANLADTIFVDSLELLNTIDKQWIYQVALQKNGILQSKTTPTSSVFLTGKPGNKRVFLSWRYSTAWNNSKYTQYIYRKKNKETTFTLLDSIAVTTSPASYINTGLDIDDTLCYYIETRGRYCYDSLPRPLINLSPQICLSPGDSTRPCPPKLSLVDQNCDLPIDSLLIRPYKNRLSWTFDTTSENCSSKLSGFNLYKAADEESPYRFYKFFGFDTTRYIDMDNESQAACYTVTAISKLGLESDPSNIECNDNCAYYALPNLITPNGDSYNEYFGPMKYPVGVKSVQLSIYNRWGALVHYQDGDPELRWNPYQNDKNFTDGVYYYYALITYERRQKPRDAKSSLKGWVHILNVQHKKE